MNFKKCERCGCFFTSSNDVCPKCTPKDNFEMEKLKNYLNGNIKTDSINDISNSTGISVKNINRFLNSTNFANIINSENKKSNDISINL